MAKSRKKQILWKPSFAFYCRCWYDRMRNTFIWMNCLFLSPEEFQFRLDFCVFVFVLTFGVRSAAFKCFSSFSSQPILRHSTDDIFLAQTIYFQLFEFERNEKACLFVLAISCRLSYGLRRCVLNSVLSKMIPRTFHFLLTKLCDRCRQPRRWLCCWGNINNGESTAPPFTDQWSNFVLFNFLLLYFAAVACNCVNNCFASSSSSSFSVPSSSRMRFSVLRSNFCIAFFGTKTKHNAMRE